jgi:hypothetical protein
MLDQRTRDISISYGQNFQSFTYGRWEESAGELYRLAGEVARKLAP